MPDAIKIENLSKKYIIGHQKKESYTALRDVLANGAKRLAHKLIHPFAASRNGPIHEEFWALKDVSFDIKKGDRVGIIGRNGAGKSTLLKVLSRITEPTSGKVAIDGRVVSLLEVGTGFHPELTGRENVFLNGAILGMSKIEIKKKFDEIVAFAEVEKFLDTPVKRYSSGMYVRLAFAVAAHLEPEILIVDEVLAVGDAQFQKKCLGKMEAVGKEGTTVLFVSHNMAAIQQLCGNGILLHDGVVQETGSIDKVIESYVNDSTLISKVSVGDIPRASQAYGIIARYTNAWMVNSRGERTTSIMSGETISFDLEITALERIDNLSLVVGFDSYMDYRITTVLSEEDGIVVSADKGDLISVNLIFPRLQLKPGTYSLALGIRRDKVTIDHVVKAIHFEVSDVSVNNRFREPHIIGDVLVESEWRIVNAKTILY